jgi:hypothetical protein
VSQGPTWSDEQLAELAALPKDHPDVQAVRSDPERWARLIALRAFLHPADVPDGARTEDAVAHLRDAVRDALDRAPSDVARQVRAAPVERRSMASWFTGWRPALAVAAALVVVGALLLPRLTERSGTLRGNGDAMIETIAPVITAEGVRFSWRRVNDADQYELRLLHADLSAAAPAVSTADTAATLPRSHLAGIEGAAAPAFWRVIALRAGREIAGSELVRLPER